MAQIPQGFILDEYEQIDLPDGFVLDSEESPQEGGDRGFWSFANKDLAGVLGAPVDLVNYGLGALGLPVSDQPFLGSESISSGLRRIGANVANSNASPETIGEYAGMGFGGATGFLLPGAGLVSLASRSASPVIRGAANTISSPFINTPARALAAESLAGIGSGVGQQVGENLSDGSKAGGVAGALVGGVVGGMGPSATIRAARSLPGVQIAEGLVAGQIAPFTKEGAMSRARGRIAGVTEDAALARENLALNTEADLSPAARTGDRRLMALEQDVRAQDASIDRTMRDAENAASRILREGVGEIAGDGNIADTRQFLSDRVNNLITKMENRVRQAERVARDRVAALEGRQSAADASVIVREELESALSAARTEERALWSAVPDNEVVPLSNSRSIFHELEINTPRAQRDDIPDAARRFLGVGNDAFRPSESVKELHGLYSELRREARNSRSGDTPNRNRARMADEIADAIMLDMQNSPRAGQALRDAVDYSRQLNERFTRGSVGRVLGNERTGGDRVPDIQTLDATVGRPGRAGASGYDEVARALVDNPQADQAIRDYTASRFGNAAIRDGELRTGPAGTFMRSNEDILNRMPEERRAIAEAISATQQAQAARRTADSRISGLERNSTAAALDRSRYGEEIQTILRSRDPKASARQLTRQASKDQTGAATLGLKSAVVDDLMSAARVGYDDSYEPMISGRAIKARMNDGRFGAIMNEVMSPNEVNRINRLADEFEKLEMIRGSSGSAGAIMGDQPNSMIAYLARVMAARSGAALGAGSSGASLQTASMASNRMQRLLMRLTNDRAEQLIVQAISGDKELFDALLTPAAQVTRTQENRIVETLSGLLGGSIEDE